MDRDLWNPQIELMPRKEIRALQLEKLKKQLIRVHEESPYYRAKFNKAKVDPHTFTSWDQLNDYPFFDKEEERISQEESKQKMRDSRIDLALRLRSRGERLWWVRLMLIRTWEWAG